MSLTVEDLKKQSRWVLWKLETRDGKQTKVPYQSNGYKASSDNPATWKTHAEVAEHAHKFSGVGLVLGKVDGIHVSGVDLDKCYDPVLKKFTSESRDIVIDLDSYTEFSPSGDGAHILVVGDLKGRKGIKLPFPGCKAVELYDGGRYLTFTERHIGKTPAKLLERTVALNELYDRVQATKPKNGSGLVVTVSLSEEERLHKLMTGDMSNYNDDHSAADFALCVLLAKKHSCNAFKIDADFRESCLYREKWERDDYRENTITRAVTAVAKETPVVFDISDEPMEEDGETDWLVESLDGKSYNGWFPKGELSIIGASSGMGKTSWAMPVLEKIRNGEGVWGHSVSKPRDYRVLLHDRSKKATRRTMDALHMSDEAVRRVLRLSSEQQSRQPSEILQSAIEASPGVEVWFIEGLDLWIPDMNKSNIVAGVIDSIQRVATRYDVAVIATVGAPKQRGKDKYRGRDSLFGSQALGRKVETVVLMSLYDETDFNGVRECWVLPRTGAGEQMFFEFQDGGLARVEKPEKQEDDLPPTATMGKLHARVRMAFGPDEPIKWRRSLGPDKTFYRWREWAEEKGRVVKVEAEYFWSATELASGVQVAEV